MAGILSKGIKFKYSTTSTMTSAVDLSDILQEVPAMGGAADKVDVTTLADSNYKYINGVKDFGDLEFTFLYDAAKYKAMFDLNDALTYFQVEFPDGTGTGSSAHGTQFSFSGFPSTATGSASVNGAMQFTVSINLNSDIAVTAPSN